MASIVLVHGAWVGPWVWELVLPDLHALGHDVAAPELHRGSLAADIAAVQQAVDGLPGPVVLCAGSYGGVVAAGVALPPGSHLVFVAAFVPDAGETTLSLSTAHPAPLQKLVKQDGGLLRLEGGPDDLDDVLWADAPASVAARGRGLLRPQALQPLAESPQGFAWRETPSTYLLCRRDRAVHPDAQRYAAARAHHVVEWECSHSPTFSRPGDFVTLLDEAAARVAAAPSG